MAFVRIDKSSVGASYTGIVEIRMGSKLKDEHGPRAVYMSVAKPIIDEIGWTYKELEDRRTMFVYVHEGTGDDAGFWMMEQTDDKHGYSLGSQGKHASFTMGISTSRLQHYVLNEHSVEPAPVDYTIDAANKCILIECPDWLRYNPQSVPEQPEAKVEVEVHLPKKLQDMQPNREQRRRIAKTVERSLRR
jgi:hypothetical protein